MSSGAFREENPIYPADSNIQCSERAQVAPSRCTNDMRLPTRLEQLAGNMRTVPEARIEGGDPPLRRIACACYSLIWPNTQVCA